MSSAETNNANKMKAVVFEKFGGVEVLKLAEITRPKPAHNEVLIEVRAMAVNHHDLLRRQGVQSYDKQRQKRLGYDCCGVIVEIGVGVKKFMKYDNVCAVIPKGDGYAEYVVVHELFVIRAPRGIGWCECAALPFAGTSLVMSLFESNLIKAGQNILIHGGAGGLGSLAIQITKYFGLRVLVTVVSKEQMKFCKELNADVCINYKLEKYNARVLEETNNLGVDFILDCSTRDDIQDVYNDIDCLARHGRLIFMGGSLRNDMRLDLKSLSNKGIIIMGSNFKSFPGGNIEDFLDVLEKKIWPAVESGKIRPKIFKTFDLDEVKAAHELIESKRHMGRIVLTTSSSQSV